MNLHGTMVCPQGTSPECAETVTTAKATTTTLEAVENPVLTVLASVPVAQEKPLAGFSI
jgi:hypothetical protein